ncbi:MAG: glutaredoxin family protein [Myxococcales bacterium]|nr:glutaredoxin family protein [Myxococcales bacterium]
MTRSPHAPLSVETRVAHLGRAFATALLCLAISTLSGCGKVTDDSRVFSAISRLLTDQGTGQTPGDTSDQSSNPLASAGATGAAPTEYVIFEADDVSKLDEPGRVPDSKALYNYVDARGGHHMVRGLHSVPAEYQARAWRLNREGGPKINRYDAMAVVRSFQSASVDPSSYFNPNQLNVTLYSAKWCGACRRAKALLDEERVAYTLRDIDDDPSAKEEVRRILGSVTIPLLDINGTYVSGYKRDTILRLIKGS